mgnify:CR=1 FL=1
MGGGKRNYNAMRRRHVQWRKEEKPIVEPIKKPSKEDIDNIIAIWEKLKKEKKKDENKS